MKSTGRNDLSILSVNKTSFHASFSGILPFSKKCSPLKKYLNNLNHISKVFSDSVILFISHQTSNPRGVIMIKSHHPKAK